MELLGSKPSIYFLTIRSCLLYIHWVCEYMKISGFKNLGEGFIIAGVILFTFIYHRMVSGCTNAAGVAASLCCAVG